MTVVTPTESETLSRDRLAAIRTELANERTLLAYLRTGLALVVGSITANHFVDDPGFRAMAGGLGALGVGALIVGIRRFVSVRRTVRRVERGGA